MTELVKYEAACRAIAECKGLDEVKAWADKAAAMQAYGRMAQDKTLEVDAAEIRIRAERRLGEMLVLQKAEGGLSRGAAGAGINQHSPKEVRSSVTTAPRLVDVGVTKDLSSRAQKLAAVPAAEFEAEVGQWRDRVGAENVRVSARLQQSGERHQATQRDDDGPSAAEIADAERAQLDDVERVRLLLESDEPLAAMTAKCVQQAEQIRICAAREIGLINEKNEATKAAKSWKAKYDKLAKVSA